MDWLSVAEAALKWGISERSVRNYCAEGRVPGAERNGKVWRIPANAAKPRRRNTKTRNLLEVLRDESESRIRGGIYHRVQVDMAYNSNHIEGSTLTHDQTRLIFETRTIGGDEFVNVDDILETVNHFRCLDLVLRRAGRMPTVAYIKELHRILKTGTSDAERSWFEVGGFKRLPNEVGGNRTTPPEEVEAEIGRLLESYNASGEKTLEDIAAFHVAFERIHPFQDGNGRVGRLVMFGECLRGGITPFIIGDDMKFYYYRGLAEWDSEPGYLLGTLQSAQDRFLRLMEYFRIA